MICDQCGKDEKCTEVKLKRPEYSEMIYLCGGCLIMVMGTRELSGNLARPVNQAVAMPVAEARGGANG